MSYDRGKDMFRRAVRFIMADVLYHVTWAAKVVSQGDDGTCEITPNTPLLGDMSGVPIRIGIPGITVQIKPGALVDFTFEDGDPKQPIITGWNTSDLSSMSITASGDVNLTSGGTVNLAPGGQPIARQGDMVAIGGPAMIPVPVLITATSVPIGAGPITGTMQMLTPSYGLVTSGSPGVKA